MFTSIENLVALVEVFWRASAPETIRVAPHAVDGKYVCLEVERNGRTDIISVDPSWMGGVQDLCHYLAKGLQDFKERSAKLNGSYRTVGQEPYVVNGVYIGDGNELACFGDKAQVEATASRLIAREQWQIARRLFETLELMKRVNETIQETFSELKPEGE